MDHLYRELRIGLVGLGLDAYWPQFSGLEDRLLGCLSPKFNPPQITSAISR